MQASQAIDSLATATGEDSPLVAAAQAVAAAATRDPKVAAHLETLRKALPRPLVALELQERIRQARPARPRPSLPGFGPEETTLLVAGFLRAETELSSRRLTVEALLARLPQMATTARRLDPAALGNLAVQAESQARSAPAYGQQLADGFARLSAALPLVGPMAGARSLAAMEEEDDDWDPFKDIPFVILLIIGILVLLLDPFFR
jgi:hypothetical protein